MAGAVTLKGRAGQRLSFQVKYWNPDKTELLSTAGYTARLQLRSSQAHGRVLLVSSEYSGDLPAPSGTVLTRVDDSGLGHWRIVLGRTMTRSMPSKVRVECELINDTDDEDARPLFSGVILLAPEGVTDQ